MRKLTFALSAAVVAWLALSLNSVVSAQTELPPPSTVQGEEAEAGDQKAEDEKSEKPIPDAALLTERGRQLAQELKMLRRTRDTMGSKHPTLPLIKQKIADVEEQLEAWEPAFGTPPPNPFHAEEATPMTPQMNEYDLRQMVIRLTRRVEELERRVLKLERAAR